MITVKHVSYKEIQWKPFDVIPLEQSQTDWIKQMLAKATAVMYRLN